MQRRTDHLIDTPRWADGQAAQLLASQNPAGLAAAAQPLTGYFVDAEAQAARLSTEVETPELQAATISLGQALAGLRGGGGRVPGTRRFRAGFDG
ncbi:MAG: hypothetical protein ACK5H2_12650 [Beutenbergiaceae bacterium]